MRKHTEKYLMRKQAEKYFFVIINAETYGKIFNAEKSRNNYFEHN